MISCGSFSFGKCECLPFSGREGKEVSFQILLLPALPPPPPLYRLPAAFPLGSLDPGHPKQVRSGASAPLGRGARGGGDREGKCNTQSAVSPVRPPKRNPRSCLACYTLKGLTRPFSLPKSVPRTWAKPVPPAAGPARLPADLSLRWRLAAGARPRAGANGMLPRCGGSVQLLPAASEARRADSSSGGSRAF